jgi:hypothetical protein
LGLVPSRCFNEHFNPTDDPLRSANALEILSSGIKDTVPRHLGTIHGNGEQAAALLGGQKG